MATAIREETKAGENSSEDAELPLDETPNDDGVQGVEVGTQTDRIPHSANLSPDEIAEFSASFVEEANSLGSPFLSRLYKDRAVTANIMKEFNEHIVPLLNFVAKQHAWLSPRRGKARRRVNNQESVTTSG